MHCGPVYPAAAPYHHVGGYAYHGGYGSWFALIVVLFILLIIIGAGFRTT